VLLGHLTGEEEEGVRAKLAEVPVVISGHNHGGLKEPIQSGNQWMGRLLAYGVELGRLDLQVDPVRKTVVSSRWKRIPIDSKTIPPAEDVARDVAHWEGKVTAMMDVPIGEAKRTIRKNEMKTLIEKVLCEMMGADLAFTGLGGVRDELPAGTILVRHIWNIFPFDNKAVMGKFRGAELPASVTQGRKVDPAKIYTVATNEFAAANQSSPRELNTSGLSFPTEGPLVRDLLVDWVKRKKVIE
jgi:5'-nucleotidase